jgi:hypothetical protein
MIAIRVRTRLLILTLLGAAGVALLAGCGEGDGTDASASSAPPPPPGPTNSAPTISGNPSGSVLQGTAYVFAPTASDANGDPLTFTITGKPSWAAFNASSGQLSGTPSGADVGTYSNIQIRVSDGSASTNLAAFAIQVVGTATGSATLIWQPPTGNTDGSPLSNLAGYHVYWGTTQGNYSSSTALNNPGLTSYVIQQLTPATWYFVVTAVNSSGVESNYSNVVSKAVL